MKHISEVWNLLEKCKTEEELDEAIGEIPNKFGVFTYERKNKNTVTVTQDYYDKNLDEYMWDKVDIDIPEVEEDKEQNVLED